MCEVYKDDVLTKRQCQNWSQIFDSTILILKIHDVEADEDKDDYGL